MRSVVRKGAKNTKPLAQTLDGISTNCIGHLPTTKGMVYMSTVWSLTNVNVNEFLQLIDSCKGNVYLVTDEGDKLNLKSKLCQLIGLGRLIQGGIVANASLVCDNIEDEALLVRFKLYGEISKSAANDKAEDEEIQETDAE